MKKSLIALTAAAGFVAAGLAVTPAAAAPVAPGQLAFAVELAGNKVTQVRSDRRHQNAHRHVQRHKHVHRHNHVNRRHFWAAGPWAFRGLSRHHCSPVRGGYICYY